MRYVEGQMMVFFARAMYRHAEVVSGARERVRELLRTPHRPPSLSRSPWLALSDMALGAVVVAGALLAAPGALLVVAAAALGEAMERRR